MKVIFLGMLALVVSAGVAQAQVASTIEQANRVHSDTKQKIDTLTPQVQQQKQDVQGLSAQVDQLYQLLQQKYSEGNNGGVVPTRERQLK
jgi:hypothetical protein